MGATPHGRVEPSDAVSFWWAWVAFCGCRSGRPWWATRNYSIRRYFIECSPSRSNTQGRNGSDDCAVDGVIVPNHALPSGAVVSAIRSATYFPHNQRVLPFVVLGVWLVATLSALMISSRALHRSPAE